MSQSFSSGYSFLHLSNRSVTSLGSNFAYNLGFQALSPSKIRKIQLISLPCLLQTLHFLRLENWIEIKCYYIFVSKCCSSNWHQLNLLRRISLFRARQEEDTFIAFSPTMWNRGLDESVIREIPTFQFKRESDERSIYGCVVCLNEFQEHDMLRVLPNCSHAFHLVCFDI